MVSLPSSKEKPAQCVDENSGSLLPVTPLVLLPSRPTAVRSFLSISNDDDVVSSMLNDRVLDQLRHHSGALVQRDRAVF